MPNSTAKERYQLYLACDCWRQHIRRVAHERTNGVCGLRIRCNGAPATQTHHFSYERLGQELECDICPCCDACHRAIHGYPPIAANDNVKTVRTAQLLLDLWGKTG